MVCEYCNMYTPHSLNKTNGVLPIIKAKYMLDNVEYVCHHCYNKFKSAEQWYYKTKLIYNDSKVLNQGGQKKSTKVGV